MTAKKAAPKSVSENEATIKLWLIEHGGAPLVTRAVGKGDAAGYVTSPDFPDPLPTLAQAMKKYPCTPEHASLRKNACKIAKKVAKAH